MSTFAIKVENLSKRYVIGHQRDASDALRHRLEYAIRNPFQWLRRHKQERASTREEFWALKDVSFDIQQGQVVGIIGRNGAGKSTLLKILSRITDPTQGRIRIKGRVASLLEVGTGFHQELTGRENIFLNGAILGMTRAEIKRKFDEIVAFSGIEKFLDTPVKRYSSGMYVRLAFAVAAHLEPDILIVDEVLAVGDSQFQKKCLGKMDEVAKKEGRTVLFVSHSMPAITRLCSHAIFLAKGEVAALGRPHEIVRHYLSDGTNHPAERTWTEETAPGDDVARLHRVRVCDENGELREAYKTTDRVEIEIDYWCLSREERIVVSIHFVNEEGTILFCSNDWNDDSWWSTPRRHGLVRARCSVPPHFLAEGRINILAALCTYNPDAVHALEQDAVSFQVIEDPDSRTARGEYAGVWPGVLRPRLKWKADYIEQEAVLQ
jgi:lipopolysaccharide transport system ATP-binding protein